MSSKPENDVYERVTQKILEAMDRGVVPWVRPWVTTLPCNAITGRSYHGINVLSTWAHQMEGGYSSSAYVTYKQAQALGGNVRRGEHGCTVVYYKQIPRSARTGGGETEEGRAYWMLARGYTLFNLDQVDGVDELRTKLNRGPAGGFEPIKGCEQLVMNTGALIVIGDRASYSPEIDTITMPRPETFTHSHAFYSTMFHELGHWTGAPSRLNRDLSGRFGDPRYACEELVAELTAAFVGAKLGIEHTTQSAAYLDNWLSALSGDRRFIVKAASLASAASDYLAAEVSVNAHAA